MSTEKNVANLNQFRKAKARADRRALADENAVKFGRSKAQKALEQAQTAKAKALLDAHKKDDR
ncbi:MULTISPECIES: DUF4169 family protein [Roseobacteraceae]|uniref:Uncharacterized protein n=1 Tax=Celeribacter baekdonensis B30 TaxID=1208323 RepID=K2JCU4_9RHOB|nr:MULTISPECIES: DUF4169 family protein [Roseobacteraceae]EKE72562.1 hypothetical protein B30_06261 [Celeribacter baekdonensis B30]KAB6714838.1 DUF4169 domain-containing protein [Roseobacter sp. TSBP12]|tara:strand:- start:7072 stop:7260 length:189 start_codon:yes stop_codon:yes gene_type:complete